MIVEPVDVPDVPVTSTNVFLLNTMRGLEAGLTVGTIASSPIVTCTSGDDVDEILLRSDWIDFDVLPVQDNHRINAVVERKSRSRRPFDSGMLVSWDQPLEEFLATPGFVDDGYRLVVYKAQIAGIVTPSDLLRLPVRVLAFALLSHLEHTMNTVIGESKTEPGTWLCYLTKRRQIALGDYQADLNSKRMNPDLLEFTYFSEKIMILEGLHLLEGNEKETAWHFNDLRNKVAHNHDYVRSQDDLKQFIDGMQGIRRFINRLDSRAKSVRKNRGDIEH